MPAARLQQSRRAHRAPTQAPSAGVRASGRRAWGRLSPLLVVLAVVAAYSNSLHAAFVLDDVEIVETGALHDLWSLRPLTGTTRPLVQLSLAFNYALGGLNVAGYHAVNVTIHALAALTLLGVVARTLRTPRLRARWSDAAAPIALAVSVLWAVHPLQTESVTYVVQRSESLMALCYLLTIYCVARGTASARAVPWYAAAVLACALGMLCKPVMVTAPIAVILYDRAFLADSWRDTWRARRPLYVGLAATWLVLVWLLAGPHESAASAGFGMRDLTVGEYARSQPGVILHYVRLALWPRGLVLDYAWPVAHGAAAAVPTAVVLALVAAAVWAFHRRPQIGFLAVAFFLVLAPSSSVIPIKDLAFEHRMYLPLAPLIALAVIAGCALLDRTPLAPDARRRVGAALVVVLAASATALTIARNRDYATAVAMWSDVATKRPTNARARNNLGDALYDAGNVDAAAAQLRTALEFDPGYADAHNNLGRALVAQGRYGEGESQLREATRLDPKSATAEDNLGFALARQGRRLEAQAHHEAAVRLDPEFAAAHNNLGAVLVSGGRYDDAIVHYREALRLKPDYVEPYANIGSVLLREHNAAEAERWYRDALRIRPSYAEVHYNLSLALAAQGKHAEAKRQLEEAVRLKPELANAAAPPS